MQQHVVKRQGHKERFDERKVYASCYAACLSSHVPHREAEKICEKVSRGVKTWIAAKPAVTADQLFKEVTRQIAKHHKDAAFMYRTHRDVS
ncbi:MAG: hypothetical protein HY369_03980 [Candidatus Aenigmarchaeota archaeon]|nr:hypothetical protein [Candidatus Aenigmarchaeota archaeon]